MLSSAEARQHGDLWQSLYNTYG
eukprot:COSAG02_NODE_40377_length_406_cov_0.843648_1_plen_22_part_10